jgi:hypothetical protein
MGIAVHGARPEVALLLTECVSRVGLELHSYGCLHDRVGKGIG